MKALFRMMDVRRPLGVILLRTLVRRFSLLSYRDRLLLNLVDRPHYGHCIFEAAQLATRLKIPAMSVVEFGCGGGNGLLNAEMHIAEIAKIFPVKIELYGFDTGEGMPGATDYRDFPHYFKPGLYRMDPNALRQKLKTAKLVLGNVRDTCKTFFSDFNPAPIGCIFHDLDYYSSTMEAFSLFDADPAHFLPRIFMYFDDIKGSHTWAVSEFAGELLAIAEFNSKHPTKKIAENRSLRAYYPDQPWGDQIYMYHDFQHPKYNVFVAANEQVDHETHIGLR